MPALRTITAHARSLGSTATLSVSRGWDEVAKPYRLDVVIEFLSPKLPILARELSASSRRSPKDRSHQQGKDAYVMITSTNSPTAAWKLRAGYTLSGLVILFMVMDAGMKLMRLPIVLETTVELGWPSDSAIPLGLLLLVCTFLYGWPRTSALGAVLLTGYLGAAIAAHARIGSPIFSHTLFGVYLGVLLWAGLYLRDPRVRALFAADT
jgi:hypothetical protein